jgi:hypothetical protein
MISFLIWVTVSKGIVFIVGRQLAQIFYSSSRLQTLYYLSVPTSKRIPDAEIFVQFTEPIQKHTLLTPELYM